MSNKRTPQRRDAHGAPVRTTREIQIAVATVIGVLALTVILVMIFRHRPVSTAPAVTPSSTPAPDRSTSTTSSAPGSTSSSSTIAPTSSTTAP